MIFIAIPQDDTVLRNGNQGEKMRKHHRTAILVHFWGIAILQHD